MADITQEHSPDGELIDVYGKKYTDAEIKNCHKFYQDQLDAQTIRNAFDYALDSLDDPKFAEYVNRHYDELLEEYRLPLRNSMDHQGFWNHVMNDLEQRVNAENG